MDFKEVKEFLEANKDSNDEVKSYLKGLSDITIDKLTDYVTNNDEGKKWLSKTNDSFFSKGLETYKEKTLPKLIDEEIKKRYPDEDPKTLELKKLQDQIDKIQREANRKDLTNKALKVATEKKLPVDLIDYFIGDDEEATNQNIAKFEKTFMSSVSTLVDEKLKQTSHVPPDNKNNNNTDPFLQGLGL